MKRYEEVPRTSLTPRMPMIIRVDGRAFHTYVKKLEVDPESQAPWNPVIRDAMTDVAIALMRSISGAKIAYLQSDEVSVLVTDYDKPSSQAWFDKVAQKVCSVTASIATMAFNNNIREYTKLGLREKFFPTTATFDARAFVVPVPDVCNYFIWRQQDCEKNSISMLAQKYFTPEQLHSKDGSQKQDMLMGEHEVNWNDCEVWQKRGWCVVRKTVSHTVGELRQGGAELDISPGVTVPDDVEVTRVAIEPDWEIPIFTKDRDYIELHVDLERAEKEQVADKLMRAILDANLPVPPPPDKIDGDWLRKLLEVAAEGLE